MARRPKIYPGKVDRSKRRSPSYNFHLKQRPYQIQPFFCAPVMPGDSLDVMRWKATSVTDPLKQRLTGWWQEWHFFYVRVRDMFPDGATDVKSIFTDTTLNLAALYSAPDPKYFHAYGVNWAKEATRLIVENYFRAEYEAPDDAVIEGMWAQTIGTDNLLDSAVMASELVGDAEVQVDVADGTLELSKLEKAQRTFELLQMGALTPMDYNDFLRTYGISLPSEEQIGKPKYLETIRNWQMPVNHIDEATGAATTACYWKTSEAHRKHFFSKEPGFLIGLTTFRPKVYLENQIGSMAGTMDSLMEWLPAVLRDDPATSQVVLPAAQGPLKGFTGDYVIDIRDLLVYGEQFTNFDVSAADGAWIDLPKQVGTGDGTGMLKRYPTVADAKAPFLNAGAEFIETDGRIDLGLSGAIDDSGTPPVSRLSV